MRNFWIFFLILFVFIYFIFPYDLIPDVFGPFGRIDDFSLLGWLIWFVRRQLMKQKKASFNQFYQQYKDAKTNSEHNQDTGRQNQNQRESYGNRSNQYRSYNRSYKEPPKTERPKKTAYDPYVILNVDRNAKKDDIKQAYKNLIKKYHPDKVAYLGEEFQKVAHKKMIDIQKAYEILMAK